MPKQFNLIRYKELLKLEETEKWVFEFTNENYIELIKYEASIGGQISYNRKESYFLLIEQYLNGTISSYEFKLNFLEMKKEDSKASSIISRNLRELETFMVADNLEQFSHWMTEIWTLCVESDWDNGAGLMPESEFYSLLNNYYLQLQKVFPVLSKNSLVYEKLISRSFKILAGIIGLGVTLIFFNILT